MKKLLLALALALVLVIATALPVFAASSDTVTITATPAYIAITVTEASYNIGGASTKILAATTYYTNPGNETTAPSETVVDGECAFTINNTSNVNIDIVVDLPDFTGGAAMTNTNLGYTTNDTNSFGASGYVSGTTWPGDAVILKNTGSSDLISAMTPATSTKKFGFAIKTISGDWSSGDEMSSTMNVGAEAS